MQRTKASSVLSLDRLVSLRRFAPPSQRYHLSLAGTLWDAFRAIPSRWQSAGLKNPSDRRSQERPGNPYCQRDQGMQTNGLPNNTRPDHITLDHMNDDEIDKHDDGHVRAIAITMAMWP
jgi:hypothetical protein